MASPPGNEVRAAVVGGTRAWAMVSPRRVGRWRGDEKDEEERTAWRAAKSPQATS
jgi:hypothetical protein